MQRGNCSWSERGFGRGLSSRCALEGYHRGSGGQAESRDFACFSWDFACWTSGGGILESDILEFEVMF